MNRPSNRDGSSRNNQQNRQRGRGRNNNNSSNNNNRRNTNPLQRSYESNGPDIKIRGNASQIAEKYTTLARDAVVADDRILAENYMQHAEHYSRIIASAQLAQQEQAAAAAAASAENRATNPEPQNTEKSAEDAPVDSEPAIEVEMKNGAADEKVAEDASTDGPPKAAKPARKPAARKPKPTSTKSEETDGDKSSGNSVSTGTGADMENIGFFDAQSGS